MDTGRLLLALRLARPARRHGFCPACRVGLTGVPPAVRGVELATDGITVAIVLGVAAVAWAVTAWQMLGSGMAMGLGSVASFATTWMVIIAAMMLPSAIPLVYRFARQAEGRRTRRVAVGMLGLVYLARRTRDRLRQASMTVDGRACGGWSQRGRAGRGRRRPRPGAMAPGWGRCRTSATAHRVSQGMCRRQPAAGGRRRVPGVGNGAQPPEGLALAYRAVWATPSRTCRFAREC